jgi:hypothetical protein
MKYSKDDIIEALRCCSLNGHNSCETCPLKEECEESPLESVLAKYTLEMVDKLTLDNKALTEQRNTYKEYALQMHVMMENIRVKVNEGHEYSTAKYMAELDMWRVIAAEKQALQDENERLRIKLITKEAKED